MDAKTAVELMPISAEAVHCGFAAQSIRPIAAQRKQAASDLDWFEILIRPHGRYRGWSPERFIERLYLERAPHLTDIEVLERAAAWALLRQTPTRISVNSHPQSLIHADFLRAVMQAQGELREAGHSLCLELVEYGHCDDRERLIGHARLLREHGVLIALDDFGSRINCFDLCAAGVVDLLKIDLRLINALEDNRNQQAVVQSILTLGLGLGASVIAEGIETQSQLDLLRQLGADYAQGFLFHRPEALEH
ncbi:EAL domain-containing protein [Wenzhouxiangella marina]|uniref:Uncharacterized protein n=1 Tax=Wenzhouxiangella marina TaxID=1579979 RepID=A0A0K0XZI9_9GAMM|nr:EAL domain-containing protein [Wenzhouxiangella marina]AKS43099.1 hypothetical protein WM2015_2742 [Wenzhouxiangella marina]MBB6087216.1 EAL domain-containing protein (putative c-di-GMP-specific phosphodiesterase class I) [Wenzhouxiangella marina]